MLDIARQQLTDLRNGLLRLHLALLDSERAAYERDVRRIASTGQYLNLVLNDPWFAWLRELSQFVVLIDETLDFAEPADSRGRRRLIARARALVARRKPARVSRAATTKPCSATPAWCWRTAP